MTYYSILIFAISVTSHVRKAGQKVERVSNCPGPCLAMPLHGAINYGRTAIVSIYDGF